MEMVLCVGPAGNSPGCLSLDIYFEKICISVFALIILNKKFSNDIYIPTLLSLFRKFQLQAPLEITQGDWYMLVFIPELVSSSSLK